MAKVTIGFGVVLVLLGIAGFLATGAKTSLIPSIEGALLILLGLMALKPAARKHAMHAAAVVGVLGILLPLGRLVPAILAGRSPTAWAASSLIGMAVLSALFIVLCVRSFIQARRTPAPL